MELLYTFDVFETHVQCYFGLQIQTHNLFLFCTTILRFSEIGFTEFSINVVVRPQDLHGCLRRLLTDSQHALGAPLSCRVQWKETLHPS